MVGRAGGERAPAGPGTPAAASEPIDVSHPGARMRPVTSLLSRTASRQLPFAPDGTVEGFHPAVAEWFRRRFPDGPTEPQRDGWPHIAAGADTLIAAPTGSGKTLAGFLVCIDRLYRAHEAGSDVDARHPGRLRLAAQGARRRHRGEPRAPARRDRRGRRRARARRARPHGRRPHRRHATAPSAPRCSAARPPSSSPLPESLYLLVTSEQRARRSCARPRR